MSEKERSEFKKDIEIALVKRWWPLLVFMFAFGLFLVKGTYWFDNNVATKADTNQISARLDALTRQIANMENVYVTVDQANATHRLIHQRIDSLISARGRLSFSGVTQRTDRYGNKIYTPVN